MTAPVSSSGTRSSSVSNKRFKRFTGADQLGTTGNFSLWRAAKACVSSLRCVARCLYK
jgi:hypothetical protein